MKYKVLHDYDIYIMYFTDINFCFAINEEKFNEYAEESEMTEEEAKEVLLNFGEKDCQKYIDILNQGIDKVRESSSNINATNYTLCLHMSSIINTL